MQLVSDLLHLLSSINLNTGSVKSHGTCFYMLLGGAFFSSKKSTDASF